MPDSVTFCGLPMALSAMLTVPVALPVLVGVNVTPTLQELPAGSWPVQPLDRAKPVVMVTLVNVTMKLPVLVTVMVCWLLVVPVTCGSNARVVGVTTKVSLGATPVPVRLITVGLPGALSVIVMVALRAPVAVGVKLTPTEQILPIGPCCSVLGEMGQPLLMAKSPALAPPSVMELIVTGEVPVLVSSRLGLMELSVVLTCGGNVMLVGPISSACEGATPLPVSVIVAGLPAAPVYVIVIVAVRVPAAVGVKVTLVLQLEKALNRLGDVGQPEDITKSPGLAPPSTTL